MLCRTVRKRLKAYRDGELRERQQRRIADHLSRCPACAAEAKDLDHTWAALEMLAETGPCPDLIDPVLARINEHERKQAHRILPVPFMRLNFAHVALCTMVIGFCAGFLGNALYPRLTSISIQTDALSEQDQYLDLFSELPAAFPGSVVASLGDEEGEE